MSEQERREPRFRQRVDAKMAAMRLPQQLVELRESRGLSQTQLARILGVSEAAIMKIESGRTPNPGLRTLRKHVLALGGRLEVTIQQPAPPRVEPRRSGPPHSGPPRSGTPRSVRSRAR